MNESLKSKIESLLQSSLVLLFMKGNPSFPQCGFSARVVQILNELAVDYSSFDILEDEEIRQGLKEYSQWPTYPQLYVNGKIIGGCDIIIELYEKGELKALLEA